MSRQELDDVMMDYLFDELSPEEVARFESSVAEHPELLQEISDHRRTLAIAATLPEAVMPRGLLDEAVRSAEAHVAPHVPDEPALLERLLGWLMQPVAVAAGLLMVVGALSLFGDLNALNETESGLVSGGPAMSASAHDDGDKPTSASNTAASAQPSSSPTPQPAASPDGADRQVASVLEMERKVRDLKVREVSPGVVSRLRQLPKEEVAEVADATARVDRRRPNASRVEQELKKPSVSGNVRVEPVKIAAASPSKTSVESPPSQAAPQRAIRTFDGRSASPKVAASRPRSEPQAGPKQRSKDVGEKSPARLLRTFKRLVAQGKLKDARRVLDTLATLPGQEDVVRQGRRTLKASSKGRATRKVKRQGGKPSKKGK